MARASRPLFPPEGLRYEREIVSPDEERDFIARFAELPLRQFEFRGHLANRRVVSYGWRYDFSERRLQSADELPEFLAELRRRAAAFAGLRPEDLVQSSVLEYSPGAAIGWHRDKAEFGDVVGVSFLSPCTFRFRRAKGAAWERFSLTAEPRSVYLLRGPVRDEWEHSIPPVPELRYSATFRSLRERAK